MLLVVYLCDFAALFLGLPTALFPQLTRETFRPSDIGVLYAALSAGGVLAALFSGTFTRVGRHGIAVAVSVGLWGLAVAGFGLTGSLLAAAGWLLLAGGALLALGVFRRTVLQTAVTDDMHPGVRLRRPRAHHLRARTRSPRRSTADPTTVAGHFDEDFLLKGVIGRSWSSPSTVMSTSSL